jgi:hypothetical protein
MLAGPSTCNRPFHMDKGEKDGVLDYLRSAKFQPISHALWCAGGRGPNLTVFQTPAFRRAEDA